jgi:hypothetical protein
MQILASCPAPRTSYSLPIERAGCFALTAVGTAVAAAAAAAAVRSQFPQSHILSRWLHRLLSFCTYTPPPPALLHCCAAYQLALACTACPSYHRPCPTLTMSRMLSTCRSLRMLRTLVYSLQSSGKPSALLASTVSSPCSCRGHSSTDTHCQQARTHVGASSTHTLPPACTPPALWRWNA